MTRSPGPEPNPRTLHDEAAAAAVRDTGPAPDRYYNALLRYLQAMSHDRLAARPDPAPAWPDPAPRLRPATLVGDVMTEEVVTAHEGAVFKEIVAALARNKIRAVPVIDDNRQVIGVVSASDLLHRVVAGPGTRPRTSRAPQSAHADTAAELMTTPAVTTRPHATIVEAAQRAAHARVRTSAGRRRQRHPGRHRHPGRPAPRVPTRRRRDTRRDPAVRIADHAHRARTAERSTSPRAWSRSAAGSSANFRSRN